MSEQKKEVKQDQPVEKKQEGDNKQPQTKDNKKPNDKNKDGKSKDPWQPRERKQGDKRQNNRGGQKKGRRRQRKKRKFDDTPIEVDIDTVIPELPKKEERLKRPDNAEMRQKIDDIENEIKAIRQKRKEYIKELEKNRTELRTIDDIGSLKELKKNKFDEKKEIKTKFNEANSHKATYNKTLDELYKKAQKYRKHMGELFRKEDIMMELDKLKDRQQNGMLSLSEEKIVIKQIAELQASLPYAEPLSLINAQVKEQLIKKKEYGKESQKYYKQLQAVNQAIREISEDIDVRYKAKQAKRDEVEPEAKTRKEQHVVAIKDLLDKKQKVYADNDERWDNYWEQQALMKRIERMQRIQKAIQRKKKMQDWIDEQEAIKQAKIDERKKNPWKTQLADIAELIDYCKLYTAKSVQEDQQQEETFKGNVDNQFKNEGNVQELVNKKDKDEDFFFDAVPKKRRGKKKRKRQRGKQSQKVEIDNLIHPSDKVELFNELKINIPNFKTEVEGTIKQLEEKVEYFKALPPPDDKVLEKELFGEKDNYGKDDDFEGNDDKPKKQKKQKKQKAQGFTMNMDDFTALGQ